MALNTPGRMDRLPYIYLLIFCSFTFVCIYGKGQDFLPSCEVMVQRGTTYKTVPQQNLTVRCPVKHCGGSLNVTWCKLLDTNKCHQVKYKANIEITQNDKHVKDGLISYLTFTRISIHDDGLYRCHLKGYTSEQISHSINISVSDLNKDVEDSVYYADELPSAPADVVDVPWLPYFYICVSIAVLVFTLTVLTLTDCYGCKRILTFNHTKGETIQERSSHMIPNLPNRNAPSNLVLYDTNNSPSTVERPPSQPPLMTNGNQLAVAITTDGSQMSDHAVYAIVNHQQSGIPAGERHAHADEDMDGKCTPVCVGVMEQRSTTLHERLTGET